MPPIGTSAALLSLLAAVSDGLKVTTFTSQHVETAVDFSSPVTIYWESTESDPQNFGIELVNMRMNPNIRERVATGVPTSDRSYTIEPIPELGEGGGFQFNLVAEDSDNGRTLARSHQFMSLRMERGRPSSTVSEATTTSSSPSLVTTLTSAPVPTAPDGMPLVPPSQRISGDYGNEDDTPIAPPNQRVSGDYGNDEESGGVSIRLLDGGSYRYYVGITVLTLFFILFK